MKIRSIITSVMHWPPIHWPPDKKYTHHQTMKVKQLETITNSWSISATVPNPDQTYPHYGANVHIGVCAKTMEEAMAAVRKQYPEVKFVNIHHRGDVHLIV